jgi:hypothetical protein
MGENSKSSMNWRLKIAFACYLLVTLMLVIFALVYLFRSEFMPYHAVAIGQNWREVEPPIQILIMALMKVTGGGWLAVALAIGIMLFIPFRNGMRWAYFAIPVIGLTTSLTTLFVTLYVTFNTPATPPWTSAAIATLLLVVGFIFSVLPAPKVKHGEKTQADSQS